MSTADWRKAMAAPGFAATMALFALAFFIYGSFTVRCSDSWNDLSRMASIQNLVEHQSWRISDSDFAPLTFDKVFIAGHYFSDKTPTLSWMGSGLYAVLSALGIRLRPCSAAGVELGYYWLTVILIGLPSAAMIAVFHATLRRFGARGLAAFSLSALLAFGSEVFAYSLVFNHHILSAAALMGGFVALEWSREPWQAHGRAWLVFAGFLAGLAGTFDLLAGIFSAGLALLAIIYRRRDAAWFVLGAAPPIMLLFALDYQITGTIWPPYMYPHGYRYPGARLPDTVAGNRPPGSVAVYLFDMLIGARGLLAYCPVLLASLWGWLCVVAERGHRLRMAAMVIGACTLALIGYLATQTNNFGGTAYGQRWLVILMPFGFFFIAFVRRPALKGKAKAGTRVVLALAGAMAIFLAVGSSIQGALNPWKRTPPPVYIRYDPEGEPQFELATSWER